jgi:hypothetical protein
MQTTPNTVRLFILAAVSAAFALALASTSLAADPAPANSAAWTKPAWLSDLSLTLKETYDDNLLGVSGKDLKPESAWAGSVSLKLGINFVPLLDDQKTIKTLSLVYQPDAYSYDGHAAENYTAHRISTVISGKADDVSFSFDNTLLYVDGNSEAPTYALNQLAGGAARQNDKFRNNYAHAPARERRNQTQDRYTAMLQFNMGDFFIRPASSLIYYNLHTAFHNTSAAPYKGYQNYVDRYDVNGGLDFGYKLTPDIAVTLGYRDGYQYQQQFAATISGDRHYSSSNYQRFLAGVEGKLAKWLTVKAAAGPDDRNYNANTPINHLNTTRLYGEGSLIAALPNNQSLTFTYKQWLFVGSTGLAPYDDITYGLAYHWSPTKQWGLDLGFKRLEANYTIGNDLAGSAPALRDDLDYQYSIGVTYAVTPHLILSGAFTYEEGKNNLDGLAANFGPAYRDFQHGLSTVGVQYKF